MSPSRIDSLSAPAGAKRVPFLAILVVLTLVGILVLIGLAGWNWLLILLVPVVAFSLYMVVNVVRVLVAEARGAKEERGEEAREE